MSQLLIKTIADFSTTLSVAMAVGATTGTLTSGLDADGIQLPTATYGFTIDRGSTSKEYITATLTGTALTNVKHITRGTGVGTSGTTKAHRKGAEVIISDHAAIKRMMDVLDGTTNLDSGTPLGYDGTASISTANQLATKAYVDAVAVAGAPDADLTTKGNVEIATTAEIDAGTATGGTSASIAVRPDQLALSIYGTRLPSAAQKAGLAATTTPAAGNLYTTQKDLQIGAEIYAADSVGSDSYAITLSPVPAAYVAGMEVRFKAGAANTGTATLNVNSLGAITIKKNVSTNLETGDILVNQQVTVRYDGINFQLISPVAQASLGLFKNGTTSKNAADASATQTITHGLGVTPKKVFITAIANASGGMVCSKASYNGTTQSSQSFYKNSSTNVDSTFKLCVSGAAPTDATAGVITFDATNISIEWTKTDSPTGTYQILWEAEA